MSKKMSIASGQKDQEGGGSNNVLDFEADYSRSGKT